MDRALIGNVDNYQQFAEVPHEPFIGSGKLFIDVVKKYLLS